MTGPGPGPRPGPKIYEGWTGTKTRVILYPGPVPGPGPRRGQDLVKKIALASFPPPNLKLQ